MSTIDGVFASVQWFKDNKSEIQALALAVGVSTDRAAELLLEYKTYLLLSNPWELSKLTTHGLPRTAARVSHP